MIAIMIDHKLSRYTEVIEYTYRFIFDTIGIPCKFVEKMNELAEHDILFCYGLLEPLEEEILEFSVNRIVFFVQAEAELLVQGKLSTDDIAKYLQEIRLFTKVPVISKKKIIVPVVKRHIGNVFWGEFKFDIIGNIYYHLSGHLNVAPKKAEQGGIADSKNCNAQLRSYNNFPYVNAFIWMIESFIKDAISSHPITYVVKKEFWPNGEEYAYAMTCEVDSLLKWRMSKLLLSFITDIYLLIVFKWSTFFRNLKEKLQYLVTNYEVYWNFKDITSILKSYDTEGTFFFNTGRRDGLQEEVDYSLDDTELISEMDNLLENNHEVGLLLNAKEIGSAEVQFNLNMLSSSLNKKIEGIRFNPKKAMVLEHINLLAETDVRYNNNMSLPGDYGFFNGIAFPYQFNIPEKVVNYWDVPIAFSDDILQIDSHNVVSKNKALDIIRGSLQSVKETNGLLVYNFSMSKFSDISYSRQLLDFTLKLLSQRNGYKGTLSEIIHWWDARSQVTIKEKDDELIFHFAKSIKKITFTVHGNRVLKKIFNGKGEIKGKSVVLEGIHEGDKVTIHAPQDQQIYLDINQEKEDSQENQS